MCGQIPEQVTERVRNVTMHLVGDDGQRLRVAAEHQLKVAEAVELGQPPQPNGEGLVP